MKWKTLSSAEIILLVLMKKVEPILGVQCLENHVQKFCNQITNHQSSQKPQKCQNFKKSSTKF